MSILKELLALNEENEKPTIDNFFETFSYIADNNTDTFATDSMELKGDTIHLDLEDRDGHRGLTYGATIQLKDDKVLVTCDGQDEHKIFDVRGAIEDGFANGDLNDLIYEIHGWMEEGVSNASAKDNPDDGDFDDDDSYED